MESEVATESALLSLMRRARTAGRLSELGFVAVNETHLLAPYRQAALWMAGRGVTTLSGVVTPEGNAPYTHFIDALCKRLHRDSAGGGARLVRAADLTPSLAQSWSDWLPGQLLRIRLPQRGTFRGGILLLAREEAWTPAETGLLAEWGVALAHELASLTRPALLGRIFSSGSGAETAGQNDGATAPQRRTPWRSRRVWLCFAVLLVMLIPVPLSVLAPAELVPRDPAVVRSPLDGVVERVLVEPNQAVEEGQPLFEFDRVSLQNRLEVARRSLRTTEAEYRQKSQLALSDEESRSALAVLQGQMREQQAEIAYLRELERRGVVDAPMEGIAIFDSAAQWNGRPVVIGEQVMQVADENAAEIEAWLSPSDIIPLEKGTPLTVYLNSDPLHPLDAELRYLAHVATSRPDGTYAYRARARLLEGQRSVRIGLKGTARLEGDRVPLIYWLSRRPLAALRGWIGI